MSLPTIYENDELEEMDFLTHLFLPAIMIFKLLKKFLYEFTEKNKLL
tara:strand:+ start:841 stop:981 length:141 start_codon:yes stop_codon:yes gene_type:complete